MGATCRSSPALARAKLSLSPVGWLPLSTTARSPPRSSAFTFTERAAAELKDRITRRVAEVKGPDFLDRLGPMFVGTIHAYCFQILQHHVPKFGNYDVLDENRHAGFLSREFLPHRALETEGEALGPDSRLREHRGRHRE